MKRRFFLKIFGLAALYLVIFVMLAFIQFNDHRRFSKSVGALSISGGIDNQRTGQAQTAGSQIYTLKNDIKIVFSGIEFEFSDETANGLAYIDTEGMKTAAYLETMTTSMNEARFSLSGGQELSFYTNTENKGKELVISALLTGDVEQILIPFKPVHRADV
ncbi:MAG: hypothetical protein LBJ86_03380, partial [Spirochaetaceae bacterium]|nr:hypothetical protein [Spirochaetaceae bacterium]